jgi:hypothetical protein
MTSGRSSVMVVAIATALLLAPGAARAQKPDPATKAEAERVFRAGESAYNGGQYAVAAQAFEEAYRLLPVPAIAFSTAQACRLQYFIDKEPRRLKRAIELYRLYLQQMTQGGRRDDAASSLAELEPILTRVEEEQRRRGMGPIDADPIASATTQLMISSQVAGARASLDGAAAAEMPLIRDVKAGAHKVRVEANGYFPVEQTATAVEGRLVVVEVQLAPRLARVQVRAPSGATIAVDGRSVATTPLARPVEVAAGKHLVTVTRRGRHAWSREIEVARGGQVDLEAELRTTGQRKLAYWVLGGAAASAITAGVYGGLALKTDSDASALADRRAMQALTPGESAEYARLVDERDDRARMAYVMMGVTGALAVTGGLLFVFDVPSAEMDVGTIGGGAATAPSVSVAPWVSSDGAGVSVGAGF